MVINNCLFSPTSENPRGFSAWCVLAKLSANPRNYSYPRPLHTISKHLTAELKTGILKHFLILKTLWLNRTEFLVESKSKIGED